MDNEDSESNIEIPQISPKVDMTSKWHTAIHLLAEGELTYEEIAEKLGIDRKTLYNWRHDEAFRREVVREARTVLEGHYPKFVRGLVKGLECGDVGALRLYAQLMGEERKNFRATMSAFDAGLQLDW